eukprot:scaffold101478_cov53-Phaeocystis_antarctica.AAC.1
MCTTQCDTPTHTQARAANAGGKPFDEIEHEPGTDPANNPVHELRALPGALPGGERRARSRARPTRARKAGET